MPWRKIYEGDRPVFIHDSGARVERVRKASWSSSARWRADHPDGSPVRVDRNSDGSEYVARPWHTDRDRPIVRYFPDARTARAAIERAP